MASTTGKPLGFQSVALVAGLSLALSAWLILGGLESWRSSGREADSPSSAGSGNQVSTSVSYAEASVRTAAAELGAEAEPTPSAVQKITAKNGRFDKELLVVPAGSAVQLTFVNEDSLAHNVAIYADEGMKEMVFRGSVITGPVAKEMVSFQAPPAGTYFFFCDLQLELNGRFIVR